MKDIINETNPTVDPQSATSVLPSAVEAEDLDDDDDEDEDEDEDYTPLPTASLPIRDKDFPPIIREIVTNAPASRKIPSFVASLSPLCALASRIRAKYYHDTTRLHALLLQVIIEGAQSSGKSFAADIESLIMNDTLKARDKAQRRLEQEYREKKKRRGANQKMEEEPQTTIRVIPPTISKTVLTKRADFYERILGDTMTFWMFAEELAQVTDAGKAGYSNLRTIMRTAYDLGSLFGIDYASDNSYSAIVDINICSMFCATPAALDEYYDSKAIEGGNITRCIICPLDDDIESDNDIFRPYSAGQQSVIRKTLEQMMNDNYDADDHLQPTKLLDMSWLDRDCKMYIKRKAKEFSLTGSEAVKVFRKRASVSAFRIASLCYYLYALEMGFDPCDNNDNDTLRYDNDTLRYDNDGSVPSTPSTSSGTSSGTGSPTDDTEAKARKRAQQLCRKIYQFMSEFIIEQMLRRWGRRFNELNCKRHDESQPEDKRLFDMLTTEFTRDQLKLFIKQIGCTTPAKQFVWMWGPKNMNVIEKVDKNHFKKKNV